MLQRDDPFAYEEVFSLILSMTQQFLEQEKGIVDRVRVEGYFDRLTKLALGEYEFARRLAFEGIKIVRMAPYAVLWERFGQKPPGDFILKFDDGLAGVDVKYYDPSKMLKKIIVRKQAVTNILRFKRDFGLNKAFLAIKRFERWYLLDAEEIQKLPQEGMHYVIDISWARTHHKLLKEAYCVLNIGRTRKPLSWYDENGGPMSVSPPRGSTQDGVYYDKINIDEDKKTFKFTFERHKTIEECGASYQVLRNIKERLERNLRESILPAHADWEFNVAGVEDLCPTVFTVSDGIDDFTKPASPETVREKVYSMCLTPLQDAKYIYVGDADAVRFYVVSIYMRIRKMVEKELKSSSVSLD